MLSVNILLLYTKSKCIPSVFNDESTKLFICLRRHIYMSHVLLLCISFLRVLVVLYLCVTFMCRLRHINDSVLSSLKMEGICLLYFSVHCFPPTHTTRAPTRAYTRISSGQGPRHDVTVRYGLQGHTNIPPP
jgi:hypothetical protein